VIVDEIHALAANKRGSHLALTLERLQALCPAQIVRIGLSATQKPIDEVARFLTGGAPCEIVDIGYARRRDLALELPPTPLSVVMSNDQWEQVYGRVTELVLSHRTTLVFVNTRRMAERAARHLGERLGRDAVAAHHGSLSKEARLLAEQRLKLGDLRVLVATASLELGLDIGDVDLVCQLGSPRSIGTFLQRAGRSGHAVGGTPKARLFPQSRDELVECTALLDSVRRGELDALHVVPAPLDVLAQQIIAEVASREWDEDALYALFTRAWPYRELTREGYAAVVRMVSEGFTTRQGPGAGYVHRDAVHHRLRERKGARLTALTSGGTIPDAGDYTVVLEPQADKIGTVNEDFAVESIAGDVFQLGNTSYRILRIEPGKVRVEDAQGAAPNIPFWLGEAPGRTDELSFAVSRLRADFERQWRAGSSDEALAWARQTWCLDDAAARQLVDYLGRTLASLGALPTQDRVVLERFFDESGGMQLVVHSPRGSRLNRAWGLALRKRFCRQFNFELQAAATEDAIVLSLSTSHSFALDEVARYLHSHSALGVLVQALLDAPLFGVRWRWNATTSLALPRYSGGRKTAPQLQRMRSEDLLAAVFPDQVACLENIVGERELPHHPLVDQTIDDCLHEAMDTEGWLSLLRRIEQGEVKLVTRELPAPSPLAAEILTAKPYAYLDDAPIEERRTQAVLNRRWSDPASAHDLGALDADAIAGVREEAWPQPRSLDEMHEALTGLACISETEAQHNADWPAWLAALAEAGRATRLHGASGAALWLPAERLTYLRAIYPDASFEPAIAAPKGFTEAWSDDEALVDVIRARLTGFGPLPVATIAAELALPAAAVERALTTLEAQGYVMRGRFTPRATVEEWCERHLLARIHRYTVRRLRREIEPVERHDFMRFLFEWQHLTPGTRGEGRDALAGVLDQMAGFEAAAGAWEDDILPARLKDYSITSLDELCRSGKLVWTRLTERARATAAPVRSTPVVLLPRRDIGVWSALIDQSEAPELSPRAQSVYDALLQHGAMFFDELLGDTRLLGIELENALGELVAAGLANSDSFAGLRALLKPVAKRQAHHSSRRPRGGALIGGMDDAGRWALVRRRSAPAASESAPSAPPAGRAPRLEPEVLEHLAMTLLRRYGVVCWRLLAREAEWLPPWRDLLRVLQRLEARGVVRGGRFINGLAGEQFALPEAIPLLREVRRHTGDGAFVCVAGTDPLNLVGTVLPGDKVPAVVGNRVLYRDGVAVAKLVAGEFIYLTNEDGAMREQMRTLLVRRH